MKTIKNTTLIFCILYFFLNTNFGYATNYSWKTAGNNTSWATDSNWTPTGVPSTNDTVTIAAGSATYQPYLDQNRTVTKLSMTSGTLNLNTYNLTISKTASFTAGTITNGKIYPNGVQAIYSGTTFNCEVNSVAGKVFLSGSTFNYHCYFEDTITNSSHEGAGGCTFNASVVIRKNSGANFGIAGTSGNTFNDTVTFLSVRSANNFTVTDQGTTYFNGNVIVGSNTNGDIYFSGAATLASGKTISIDATTGFAAGTLHLNNFTQSGSTAQSFTLTSAATVSCYNATWNGAVSITAPHVLLKTSTFNSTAYFEQTHATIGSVSDGGNTFNGAATLSCSGAVFRMGTTYDDTFNSDLTVIGGVSLAYSNTTILKGNLNAAGSGPFNSFGVSGTLKFAGSNSQHISSAGVIGFNKIKIDKTGGSVTLDSTITVDDTLTFVNKNIISTSTHILSMLAGSTVTGASNSSFVSGPVKKTGNTAFVFPTGKGSDYRSVSISAPSNATDAFTGEYLNAGQSLGNSMDGTIKYIHNCGYWNLARNTGSSNVTVSLSWDSAACDLLDSATVKVGNWNGSTWKDLGNGGVTGNKYVGKVANSTTVITWGNFALAYNKCFITAAAGSDQSFCRGDSVTIGGSPVASMGMTPYTYSWSPSGGLSSPSAANPKANPSSTTNYVVSVTDLSGCAITDTATITYHPIIFTWTGSTDTTWENSTNWSPSGVPLYCDNVIIVSGSNNVYLNSDVSINGFTINSGTVDLQLHNLNIAGKAGFNAGNINNGEVEVDNSDSASFNGTSFGAALDITANMIFLNGSQFDSIAEFLQIGNNTTYSAGGNIFNGTCVIENSGNGDMYFAVDTGDTFANHVTFIDSSAGWMYPCSTDTNYFAGNLTVLGNSISFSSGTGIIRFSGNNSQIINADDALEFVDVSMKKTSGFVTLNQSIKITGVLELIKGVIVSDTINLLKMNGSSSVSGASQKSFVNGPIEKIGNSAFVFPIGKNSYYRPLEISAPSSSTDAYIAEYYAGQQSFGDNMDGTLGRLDNCNYWNLRKTTGSSNVYAYFYWNNAYCQIADTGYLKIASWQSSVWDDLGHGQITGNYISGKMKTPSLITHYGNFVFAYDTLILHMPDTESYPSGDGFVKNKGQLLGTDTLQHSEILYYGNAGNTTLYLSDSVFYYVYATADTDTVNSDSLHTYLKIDTVYRMNMKLFGINSNHTITPFDTSHGYKNYFYGDSAWTHALTYQKIRYDSIYDKIDLSFYNNDEFRFNIGATGDPSDIKFYYQGADSVKIVDDTLLNIYTPLGNKSYIIEANQFDRGEWTKFDAEFQKTDSLISFSLGSHTSSIPIMLDVISTRPYIPPLNSLRWSTYYNELNSLTTGSIFADVYINEDDNVFTVGTTTSQLFPVTQALYGMNQGNPGSLDAVVVKFRPDRTIQFSTFYGGWDDDFGTGIVEDVDHNVIFTGYTFSDATPTPAFPQCACGGYTQLFGNGLPGANTSDAFVVKLNETGLNVLMSTYYGGSGSERTNVTISLYDGNNFIIGGYCESTMPYPSPNPNFYYHGFNSGLGDGFLAQFDENNVCVWATHIGGSSGDGVTSICSDDDNNIYVLGSTSSAAMSPPLSAPCTTYNGSDFPICMDNTPAATEYIDGNSGGFDQFVMKFSSNHKLRWSTEFGGAANELITGGIAVSPLNDDIFITGGTNSNSSSFPVRNLSANSYYDDVNLGLDGYIAKFSKFFALRWCTYYGDNSGDDWCTGADINNNGDLYITGITRCTTLTMKYSICQPFYDGTNVPTILPDDGFILRFDADGASVYRTYLGGTTADNIWAISCQKTANNIIVTGYTRSTTAQGFPFHDFNPNSIFDWSQSQMVQPYQPFISNLLDAPSCRIAGNANDTMNTTITVFPNPSPGNFVIRSSGKEMDRIQITDIIGKIVFINNNFSVNLYKCDMSRLPDGIYIVEVAVKETIFRNKIIVTH